MLCVCCACMFLHYPAWYTTSNKTSYFFDIQVAVLSETIKLIILLADGTCSTGGRLGLLVPAVRCGLTALKNKQAKAMNGRKPRLKELAFDKKNIFQIDGNPKTKNLK